MRKACFLIEPESTAPKRAPMCTEETETGELSWQTETMEYVCPAGIERSHHIATQPHLIHWGILGR